MNARGFRSMTVTLLLLAVSVAIVAAAATHPSAMPPHRPVRHAADGRASEAPSQP